MRGTSGRDSSALIPSGRVSFRQAGSHLAPVSSVSSAMASALKGWLQFRGQLLIVQIRSHLVRLEIMGVRLYKRECSSVQWYFQHLLQARDGPQGAQGACGGRDEARCL